MLWAWRMDALSTAHCPDMPGVKRAHATTVGVAAGLDGRGCASLLHTGEHVPGVRARVDLSKDVGNDAVLIDNIGDAARQTGAASAIGFAQDMLRIAQEREAETGIVGKGAVVFDRIKAHTENLHVALHEGVIEGEEPAPFGGSSPGAGFGIKSQDDLFATEIP